MDNNSLSLKNFGEFNPYSHSMETANLEESINDSIYSIISTFPGERIMEKNYGVDLGELVFKNLDVTLKTKISNDIKRAITKFESRIDIISIEISEKENTVYILVSYIIKETKFKKEYTIPIEKN